MWKWRRGEGDNYTLVCEPEGLLIPNAATLIRAEWRWGALKTTGVPFSSEEEEVEKNVCDSPSSVSTCKKSRRCLWQTYNLYCSLIHSQHFPLDVSANSSSSGWDSGCSCRRLSSSPSERPDSPPPARATTPELASQAGNRPRQVMICSSAARLCGKASK